MSKEILEKALETSKKIEEMEKNKMKIAKAFGQVAGAVTALALDTTVVWAILVYLIGLPVSWVAILGGVLLFQIVKFKVMQ